MNVLPAPEPVGPLPVFKIVNHSTESWASWICSTPLHSIKIRFVTIQHPAKIPQGFLISINVKKIRFPCRTFYIYDLVSQMFFFFSKYSAKILHAFLSSAMSDMLTYASYWYSIWFSLFLLLAMSQNTYTLVCIGIKGTNRRGLQIVVDGGNQAFTNTFLNEKKTDKRILCIM
jgi:hypothetical protein